MATLDLCRVAGNNSNPIVTVEQIFLRGVALARSTRDMAVWVPTGPSFGDRAVLDGRLLAQDGVEVF